MARSEDIERADQSTLEKKAQLSTRWGRSGVIGAMAIQAANGSNQIPRQAVEPIHAWLATCEPAKAL